MTTHFSRGDLLAKENALEPRAGKSGRSFGTAHAPRSTASAAHGVSAPHAENVTSKSFAPVSLPSRPIPAAGFSAGAPAGPIRRALGDLSRPQGVVGAPPAPLPTMTAPTETVCSTPVAAGSISVVPGESGGDDGEIEGCFPDPLTLPQPSLSDAQVCAELGLGALHDMSGLQQLHTQYCSLLSGGAATPWIDARAESAGLPILTPPHGLTHRYALGASTVSGSSSLGYNARGLDDSDETLLSCSGVCVLGYKDPFIFEDFSDSWASDTVDSGE